MENIELLKTIGACAGVSQMYVATAFALLYFSMLLCKSSDGLTNLAMIIPGYVYAFSYIIVSLFALLITVHFFTISKEQ